MGRIDLGPLLKHAQDDGGAGQGGDHAQEERLAGLHAREDQPRAHETQDPAEELNGAAQKGRAPHPDQVGEGELEADRKEHEDDADLGELLHLVDVLHDRQPVRSEQHAGEQEAHDGR